jgi:HEAT repeat protein
LSLTSKGGRISPSQLIPLRCIDPPKKRTRKLAIKGTKRPDTLLFLGPLEAREQSVQNLKGYGEQAAPILLIAFKDQDDTLRRKAAQAVASIGQKAGPLSVVPALINALKDEDTNVRRTAGLALGMMEEKASAGTPQSAVTQSAVPALINALKDKDKVVRLNAMWTLALIESKASAAIPRSVIPVLIKALEDEQYHLRLNAATALANMGEDAVPAVLIAVKDQDRELRSRVVRVLRRIGKKAVPALVNALQDKSAAVRVEAAILLMGRREMDDEAARGVIVKVLVNALKNEDTDLRKRVAGAFVKSGEKNDAVIAALKGCLNDPDEELRAKASKALKRLDKR